MFSKMILLSTIVLILNICHTLINVTRLPLEKWFVLIGLKGTYFRHLEKGDQGKEAKRFTSQAAASTSDESDLSSDENEHELSEPESINHEDVAGS